MLGFGPHQSGDENPGGGQSSGQAPNPWAREPTPGGDGRRRGRPPAVSASTTAIYLRNGRRLVPLIAVHWLTDLSTALTAVAAGR